MKQLSDQLKSNWKSGLTVSFVSIPLSISLAIAAGSTPVAGIVTAIWAGFFAALFGGSRFNIVGPTGALSGILATYAFLNGAESLAFLALAVGIVIIISGLLRLERFLIFIPANTIHGFTLGVAFIIAINQLNAALGLQNIPGHEKFIDNFFESLRNIQFLSMETFIVFVTFLTGILITERYRKRIKLLANIPATALFAVLGVLIGFLSSEHIISLNIQTLGSKYAHLSGQLFIPPHLSFNLTGGFISAVLTVSLIAIIETMLSARIADSMTKTKHNKKKEMFGLGIANIASGLAGGIPATAALARTSLNIKSGATDRASALVSSLSVAIISLFLLPYFKYIPMAVIAAILVTVAVRMVEQEHFVRMYKIDKKSFIISMLVALVTIYEDPTIGILFGVAISLFFFLENISQGRFELGINDLHKKMIAQIAGKQTYTLHKNSHTIVYSIKGHLTYIDSQAHLSRFETEHKHHKNIILRLRELSFIDIDGVDAFEEIVSILERRGIEVYVTGVNDFILHMLHKSKHFIALQEKGRVFPHTTDALRYLGFKIPEKHVM
ncbi:MAG TPA: SulP family inorganic anion transporter [Candidatus Levybacteria bacterium]|nr:SulP family inorganic anion transporter [Candidatus Levybacteria bacterium]